MRSVLIKFEDIEKTYTRGRTYFFDEILDFFITRRMQTFQIPLGRMTPSYTRKQINMRIKERYLDNMVKALVTNNNLYLEK